MTFPKIRGFPSSIGGRLRTARLAAGWSQANLAKAAGLSDFSAVGHIECERREPRVTLLMRLAHALGVSTDYLLGAPVSPNGRKKKP